jgi:glycosyltransferase involved in cell wall biosynthesis
MCSDLDKSITDATPGYSNLSICIPAYNEERAIGETLANLLKHFSGAEIIVVNDGSTDTTADNVCLHEGVRLLSHTRNIGYGAALKTAARNASRPFIAWFDSDGQHKAQDLAQVVRSVLTGESDAAIGVRSVASDKNVDRIPGKFLLRMAAEFIVGSRVPDLNSGMRCFRREILLRYLHLLPDGFSASSTSTLLLMKGGFRIKHVPITSGKRLGRSTVKWWRDGLRTFHLLIRMMILFEAFRFFSVLSLVQLFLGSFYGIIVAWTTGRGFPVLAAVVVLSGVLTFFMGLVCDQIVALRMERLEGPTSEI